jgi:anti-sigma-K factor RskA
MNAGRDELDRLAGEYALGLLGEDERGAFEALLARNSGARFALRRARERFAELDATAPASQPTPALWSRIEAKLDQPLSVAASNVVPLRRRPAPASRFWHGFAAAAAAAIFLVAVGYGTMRSVLIPQPQLIVVLLTAEAQPAAIVEAYHGEGVRVVPLQRFDLPAGKALQVWTLPNRETGPVSVGLLEGIGATTLRPDLPAPRFDQFYEITVEQAGGSPTGKPTGPVLAKGFARAPQI